MWPLLYILCFALNLTLAAPLLPARSAAVSCPDKVFNIPWSLTNIAVYVPDNSTSLPGTIDFDFCDTNANLQMETHCNGTVTNGTCQADNGGYVFCANSSVAFQFAGGNLILIERWYLDDCLGEFPYNSGIAFGQNNTDLSTPQPSKDGLFDNFTQTDLPVKVSELTVKLR